MKSMKPMMPLTNVSEPLMIDALKSAKNVVVFTGAGVSAESGIPTFRDAMTGLWKNFDAETLATAEAYRRDPALVWGWYEWRRKLVVQAQPNPAHCAIARLAECVPRLTLVTQNVDNLHERAGSTDVLHLHGSLFTPRCFSCEQPFVLPDDQEPFDASDSGCRIEPPRCQICGDIIRPGVVWFGESLSGDSFGRAKQAVHECDVMFSVGTSSLVYPAALLPFEAAERGATVIQVNPTETTLDAVARFNVRGPAGRVMEALINAVWA